MKHEYSLIFSIEKGHFKLTHKEIDGFLSKISDSEIIITNLQHEFVNAPDMSKFRGLFIKLKPDSLEVYTDHFSSIPAYYTISDSKLIISNNFKFVASRIKNPTIDKVGFWELLIFENTLLDRTLFSEVKFLQSGSYLKVDEAISEERYFNFDYEKRSEINDSDLDIMIDTFKRCFKELVNKDYIFPISGGFDSRLFLSLFDKEKSIREFVTYGYNKNIIENTSAKKVIDLLKYDKKKHYFHKLSEDKYLKDINELSEISGGFIGVQNTHLFSYLSDTNLKNANMISGVLADGIFGYGCDPSSNRNAELTESKYHQTFVQTARKYNISKEIVDEIKSDLENLFSDWKMNSALSGFDEYLYIRERNSKFMFGLVNIWRRYTNVIIPPLDHRIEKLFMSLPDNIRVHKKIINLLLSKINPELLKINNVSSVFRNKDVGLGSILQNFEYKLVQKINLALQYKIKIPLHILNRFDTEIHNFNYLNHHKKIISKEIKLFQKNNPDVIPENILEIIDGTRGYQLYSNIVALNH